MTHPTNEQLHAWLDGEPDAAATETAAHVAACARCQDLADGVGRLRAGLRAWSEDAVPAPADDAVDAILRAVEAEAPGSGVRARAPAPAGASSGPEGSGAATTVTAAGSNVVPLASRRRLARAIVPALVAAAAAAVIGVLYRGGASTRVPVGNGPEVTHVARRDDAAHPVRGVVPAPGAEEPAGSEVLAVRGDGAGSYAVLEVDGQHEGTTVAVVWIEDEPDSDSATVQ